MKMKIKRIIYEYFLYRKVRKEGGPAFSKTLRKYFHEKYNINIGYGTYGGCFNHNNNIPENVEFGNYCSIAGNLRIIRADHPKNYFTLHPLFYNPDMGFVKKDQLKRNKLMIGHDVWIGEWSVILPKVSKIGNGAIIGAGSIVTKNVEPYTIVGGNPAKRIGKRFSDETIEQIEQTQWWNWDKATLLKNINILEDIINEK